LQDLEKDRYIIEARKIREEQDEAYNKSFKQDKEKKDWKRRNYARMIY